MGDINAILASIMYMMTRYSGSKDPDLARAITDHLNMLQAHPDCDHKIIHKTARRLALNWHQKSGGCGVATPRFQRLSEADAKPDRLH